MLLLYIPHHNPDDGTGSYRLIHFCCPWGPSLWASWGLVWWLCFPWNVPVYHTYHMFVLCFWLYPLCMGWQFVLPWPCCLVCLWLDCCPGCCCVYFHYCCCQCCCCWLDLFACLYPPSCCLKPFVIPFDGPGRDNCTCPVLFLGD